MLISDVPQKNCLKGKVVLVTGASSGIGRAVAMEAAAFGATVILFGRTIAKLEQVYDEIVKLNYPEPIIYPIDVLGATPNDYQELSKNIMQELKRLDAIVFNTGILPALSPVEHTSVKNWYNIMQTNLHSAFLLTKELIGLLNYTAKIDEGESSKLNPKIIFTTNHTKDISKAFFGAYAVAAAGLNSYIEILSQELENSDISVHGIYPGRVLTSLRTKAYPSEDYSKLVVPYKIAPGYINLISESKNTSTKLSGKILEVKPYKQVKYEQDLAKIINLSLV